MVRFPGAAGVHPSVPVRNVGELIALAKAKPGTLGYSLRRRRQFQSSRGELFSLATGVKILHVPYKGVGPGMMALLAGDVQLMFNNIQTALEHVPRRQDRSRSASASRSALPLLPDVPTVAETVPGFDMAPWVGIIAPANTPKDVVARLSQEVMAVMRDPETASRCFADQQKWPRCAGAGRPFGQLIAKDLDKWAP